MGKVSIFVNKMKIEFSRLLKKLPTLTADKLLNFDKKSSWVNLFKIFEKKN